MTPDELSPEDLAALEAVVEAAAQLAPPTFEELVTAPEYFGLTTATPLQRAICRVIDRRPRGELAADPSVQRAFGGDPEVPKVLRELMLVAAVRGGKSLFAAALGVWASQHCDLTGLREGEIPRFAVVSLSKDNATVIMQHLSGALAKPALRALVVPDGTIADPEAQHWRDIIDQGDYAGSTFLWHPSGRPVELRVVAGKRAGGSIVSRWLIGLVLDEAPRMVGASEGVVNYDDMRGAALSRLRPGSIIFSIGSPWAPFGPVYEIVEGEWGHQKGTRLVLRARGDDLNPALWTREAQEELKASDPVAYRTDFLAEFADIEEALFPLEMLNAAKRKDGGAFLPYVEGQDYSAAMDPATRGNAWTLTVWTLERGKKRVAFWKQWVGSSAKPLRPREVLHEAALLLRGNPEEGWRGYGLDWCYTDQWSADANRDIAAEEGLALVEETWTQRENTNAYTSFKTELADGRLELPDDPLVSKDLRMIKRRVTQAGVSIVLVKTPDGRHADYGPALVRGLRRWLAEDTEKPPPAGTPERASYDDAQAAERELDEVRQQSGRPWWAQH